MRRFPVETLVSGEVVLDEEASHHLLRVVRLGRGDAVRLFDGSGVEADGRLVDVRDGLAVLEVDGPLRDARPPYPLHLLLGLPKGGAADAALRMATEAGATHLHPIVCARSIARGDRGDRWRRIALSAAQQCGRADVPEVSPLRSLDQALAVLPQLDLRIAAPGAAPLAAATGPAAVLVGPEGGLTDDEIARAVAAGGREMGLGRWILRAETAAAVAVAMTAPSRTAATRG